MAKSKTIIYEKLNLITLCIALIGKSFFKEQYFIDFSDFIKKYLFKFVSRLDCRQLHVLDFLGTGFKPRVSKTIMEFTEKIIKENRNIVSPLINYGKDEKYIHLVTQILNESLFLGVSKYYYLKLFSEESKTPVKGTIWFLPTKINNILSRPEYKLPNISVITFHYPILKMIDLFFRLFYGFCFVVFPLCEFIVWLKNGQIALRIPEIKQVKKDVLFEHRNLELIAGSTTRDMYLFRSGIVGIRDCIHVTSYGKFSGQKSSYLKKEGGVVMDYHSHKVSFGYISKRLFSDYSKFIIKHAFTLSFNKYANFIFIKGYLSVVHHILKFENFIRGIDVRLIYFENEQPNSYKVYSIIASKYGIKTMSMLHGFGPTVMPYYSRANALFSHYLVPGKSRFYLESICPGVEKFCEVGNHEIDDGQFNFTSPGLLEKIREKKKQYTVVGVVPSYYYPFFLHSQRYPLFYDKTWEMFKKYWMPFFEWAGSKKDIFFIFQGKKYYKQYEHPYLKKGLRLIPQERYIQDNDLYFQDVIALADLVVSSRNESTIFSSLCMGIPTVSLDFMFRGFNLKKYYKYIVAETPEELIANIEFLLKKGFPETVYNNFRKDFYGIDGNVDGKTHLRIKKIIQDIVKG